MHDKGKIACLLADGFEDSEFQIPCDWLSAAGYTVEIVGARAGDALKGEKGRETVVVDLSIDEADVDSYEGMLIPGGHSPDLLRGGRSVRGVRARLRRDRTPAGGRLPWPPDPAHGRTAGRTDVDRVADRSGRPAAGRRATSSIGTSWSTTTGSPAASRPIWRRSPRSSSRSWASWNSAGAGGTGTPARRRNRTRAADRAARRWQAATSGLHELARSSHDGGRCRAAT